MAAPRKRHGKLWRLSPATQRAVYDLASRPGTTAEEAAAIVHERWKVKISGHALSSWRQQYWLAVERPKELDDTLSKVAQQTARLDMSPDELRERTAALREFAYSALLAQTAEAGDVKGFTALERVQTSRLRAEITIREKELKLAELEQRNLSAKAALQKLANKGELSESQARDVALQLVDEIMLGGRATATAKNGASKN